MPASVEPLRSAIGNLEQLAANAGRLLLTELAYRYAADYNGLMLVGTASTEEARFSQPGTWADYRNTSDGNHLVKSKQ